MVTTLNVIETSSLSIITSLTLNMVDRVAAQVDDVAVEDTFLCRLGHFCDIWIL